MVRANYKLIQTCTLCMYLLSPDRHDIMVSIELLELVSEVNLSL